MNPPIDKKPRSSAENLAATVLAYDRELHGFLLRRLRGRGSPEDIRQEIYLRLMRFSDAELVREPRAYLYRVARNVLHDKLLLGARERATFVSSDSSTRSGGITEDPTAQVNDARDLDWILSQLPPLYRDILLLRTAQGLSYDEIAQQLQLSRHTVKKYMHSALVECRLISVSLGLK